MQTGCFTRRTGPAWEGIAIETVIEIVIKTQAGRSPAMRLSRTWSNLRIPDIQIAQARRNVIFPAVISMDREDRQKRRICRDVPENAQTHVCRDVPENAQTHVCRDVPENAQTHVCRDAPKNAQTYVCRFVPENAESQGPGDQEESPVCRGAPENGESGERLAPRGREGNPVRRGVPESGGRLDPRVSPGLRGRREQQAPRDPGETLARGGRQVRPVTRKTVSLRHFLGQEVILPEKTSLPLKTDIPDVTRNITLCNEYSVSLTPGCYAVCYYISTVMKRHGFIKLAPIFNDSVQTVYAAYAEASKRKEMLALSRYFIVRIPDASTLFFSWTSSCVSKINMNMSIVKLYRE